MFSFISTDVLFLWALLVLLHFMLMLWTFRRSLVFHYVQKRRYGEFCRIEETETRKSPEKAGGVPKSLAKFRWVVGIIVSLVAWGSYLLSSHSRGFGSQSCCSPPAPASSVWVLHPGHQNHLEISSETHRPRISILINQSAASVSLGPTYQTEVRWPLTPEAVVSWNRAAAWTLLLEHIPTIKHSLSSKPMWQKHKTFDWQEREYRQIMLARPRRALAYVHARL